MLYGLEAIVLSTSELQILSDYHRQTLRCIQHLPKCTAIPAIHLLAGVAPLEALIDTQILSLLRNAIAGDQDCPPLAYIQELLQHQFATKGLDSASWTTHVRKLLNKYNLPQPSELLSCPPSKKNWKDTIKSAVNKKWTEQLCKEAEDKSTLKYLNLSGCQVDRMHPIWSDLKCPLDIEQATVKALLLVQRYPLTTSPVTGTRACAMCPLCQEEPETLMHFLLHCTALQQVRTKYLQQVLNTCRQHKVSVDPESLIRIILDSTHLPTYNPYHEKTCRQFIFKIHSIRSVILGGEAGYSNHTKTR